MEVNAKFIIGGGKGEYVSFCFALEQGSEGWDIFGGLGMGKKFFGIDFDSACPSAETNEGIVRWISVCERSFLDGVIENGLESFIDAILGEANNEFVVGFFYHTHC